jgi:hypothetical protein
VAVERLLAGGDGVATAHLDVGEKLVERMKVWLGSPFIGGGERQGSTVVPHVYDGWPTARWSDSDAVHVGFPSPGSLTGGPRSLFSNQA